MRSVLLVLLLVWYNFAILQYLHRCLFTEAVLKKDFPVIFNKLKDESMAEVDAFKKNCVGNHAAALSSGSRRLQELLCEG